MTDTQTRQLENIFSNVNDWLLFAEAKNGALLAFNGAAAFAVMRIALAQNELALMWVVAIALVVSLSGLASLANLLSFHPKLTPPGQPNRLPQGPRNIIYFGHLAQMTSEEILQEIGLSNPSRYVTDLSDQIAVNARIALKKYAYFSFALTVTIFSGAALFIIALLYWIFTTWWGT